MKRTNTIPSLPPLPEDAEFSPCILINEIARLFGAIMRDKDDNMSQEGSRLLMFCLLYSDGVTQLDLVNSTHLKPPTVSVTLKRLEADGYVRRMTDEDDNRAQRVFLTDAGREMMRRSIAKFKETEEAGLRGISEKERGMLISILTKMRQNMLEQIKSEQNNRE